MVTDEEGRKLLEGATTFLTGFHGLGEVGYIACKHIVEQLDAKRVATISSSVTPPFIAIDGNSLRLPFEIFVKDKIAIFVPHFHLARYAQVEFSAKLGEWVKDNFEEAFLIGGLDKRLKDTSEEYRLVPTSQYLKNPKGVPKERIEELMLQEGLFVTGPLAVMIGMLDLQRFPALAVLAYATRERPDPAGSANAVKCLNVLLSLDIEVESLIENARKIEEEIKKKVTPTEPEETQTPVYT